MFINAHENDFSDTWPWTNTLDSCRSFASFSQPGPQGFSLKKWVFEGKALGTRLSFSQEPVFEVKWIKG